jgi:hypothetical protein
MEYDAVPKARNNVSNVVPSSRILSTLMMEAKFFSKMRS